MDKPGARRQMEVTMVGQKFKVRSDGDENYLQTLAAYVDKKIADISKQTRTMSTQKVAVLAALDIADEYFRAHQKLKTLRHEVRRRSRRLLDILDNNAAQHAAE